MILLTYLLLSAQLSSPTQLDCSKPSPTAPDDKSRASKSDIDVWDLNFRSQMSGRFHYEHNSKIFVHELRDDDSIYVFP